MGTVVTVKIRTFHFEIPSGYLVGISPLIYLAHFGAEEWAQQWLINLEKPVPTILSTKYHRMCLRIRLVLYVVAAS